MKSLQKGFTLIELMIVIAIIGILAAIALPMYQDYTVRAKVTEGLAVMSPCKLAVAEFFSANSSFPTGVGSAGCDTGATKYVSGVAVTGSTNVSATVVATYAAPAEVLNKKMTLTATPKAGASGGTFAVDWACTGDMLDKYKPASCR